MSLCSATPAESLCFFLPAFFSDHPGGKVGNLSNKRRDPSVAGPCVFLRLALFITPRHGRQCEWRSLHPFPHMPAIEEGFQSSEEGSDLHSPIFEAPYTNDPRYHLGHLNFHDVATHLLPHRRPLTLAIPSRAFPRTSEIPTSWRHYRPRAPQPFTTYHRILIPTPLFMNNPSSIWLASLAPRRGPDKRPGTRQRSCKKRPPDAEPAAPSAKKKRKVGSEGDPGVLAFDMKVKENVTGGAQRAQPLARGGAEEMPAMRVAAPAPLLLETSIPPRGTGSDIIYPKDDLSPSFRRSSVIMSFATPVDVNVHTQPHEEEEEKSVFIPISSPIDYSRKTWWDELLDTYNPTSRDQSCKEIFADLNFLFTTSSYWLSFINIPVFFRDLRDPTLRARMQPCLIMSSLALATLMRSSEIEMGSAGRQRALWLRNLAHQSLEAACSNQSVDYAVAEAALILALFESSCHPFYTIERANDALVLLDRLIQVLQLLLIDSEDRDVNAFPPRVAPVVYLPHNYRRRTSARASHPAKLPDPA
ncbi:hypothetical protein A0H81_09310 [Grifola frondosa]|uniref:Transcription factor domain-containing protein n=1 Tax=Grifola frondosa TaxID=5627 RepID=A0A1C7M2R4_GRIFR|nr:hypothetical protein A0H81_09310 [Grifola frondosa]